MTEFSIQDVSAESGRIGICPMPGRYGAYHSDLGMVRDWRPDLVLTMTEHHELERFGVANIAGDLAKFGCDWIHLPIADFGAPTGETLAVCLLPRRKHAKYWRLGAGYWCIVMAAVGGLGWRLCGYWSRWESSQTWHWRG